MTFNSYIWKRATISYCESKILQQLRNELEQPKNKYKDKFRQPAIQNVIKNIWKIICMKNKPTLSIYTSHPKQQ